MSTSTTRLGKVLHWNKAVSLWHQPLGSFDLSLSCAGASREICVDKATPSSPSNTLTPNLSALHTPQETIP